MSRKDWNELVKRYADGRPICNCGDAYYSPCGRGIDGAGRERTDMLACQHGCSANQIFAKEEIAARVLAELKTPNDRVEGRDAALSRRVPSHDGLCPGASSEN